MPSQSHLWPLHKPRSAASGKEGFLVSKNKKINPKRRPATQADVQKAIRETVTAMSTLFLTVLRDKDGYEKDRLCRVWENVNRLSDSIEKGYVSLTDLRAVLEEEAGIRLQN